MPDPARLTGDQVRSAAVYGLALEVAQLKERLAAADNGLAEWYRRDRLACANWCDEIGDPSGALLGRIRALAAYGAQKEPTGNHAESSATRGDTNE